MTSPQCSLPSRLMYRPCYGKPSNMLSKRPAPAMAVPSQCPSPACREQRVGMANHQEVLARISAERGWKDTDIIVITRARRGRGDHNESTCARRPAMLPCPSMRSLASHPKRRAHDSAMHASYNTPFSHVPAPRDAKQASPQRLAQGPQPLSSVSMQAARCCSCPTRQRHASILLLHCTHASHSRVKQTQVEGIFIFICILFVSKTQRCRAKRGNLHGAC